MNTKKVKISAIIEIEENAFKDLIKSDNIELEAKFKTKRNDVDYSVYYEQPEIQSINNLIIKDTEPKRASSPDGSIQIEKEGVETYTVGEVIDILSKFPRDYEFLCCGESDYAIWIDHDSQMVSVDRGKFIDQMLEDIKNNVYSFKID